MQIDVLIIGGGVASVRAARTLRREKFDGSILIVGDEPTPPYNRPPLSKELLRDDVPDDLVLAEPEAWYERRGIDLRTDVAVEALDLEARTATLADGTTISFDRCLIATGAEPVVPPIAGVEHAFLLRTLADARRLREAAMAAPGARAVIVGGGFIGVEVASSLASLGLRPTIVEREASLWGGALGAELGTWAVDRLTDAGIDARLGAAVTSIAPDGVEADGTTIQADLVLVAVGVRPRTDLAAAAGLDVDDGIVTDAGHRTSHPAAWAAGDVARVDGRRIEHWHSAREGGERAALAMLDGPLPPPSPPWFFSEVGGVAFDVIGGATAWDEARWVRPASVLAYLDGDRVVQLAVIGPAVDLSVAREAISSGMAEDDLEALLTPA